MDISPDINQVMLELSNQVALLARENAILKSIVAQQKAALDSITSSAAVVEK
jgi:hypothetical protein